MHTPKTCDDCTLTWDHKHNVKDIVLCPLHRSAPKLLEALEKILAEVSGRLGKGPASAASCNFIRDQAFVAITETGAWPGEGE